MNLSVQVQVSANFPESVPVTLSPSTEPCHWWQNYYGKALADYIRSASVVYSPLYYTGRAFPSFLRIGMSLRHSVPIVTEQGDDARDRQELLARALGGVYLVPYHQLSATVDEIAADPTRWRLNAEQAARWNAFNAAAVHWDGTFGALEELLSVDSDLYGLSAST